MNADRIAQAYRWMEYAAFAGLLQRCRGEFLERCGDARRMLVLGDGDGRFTAELVKHFPELTVDSVDASVEMLRLARARVGPNARVTFLHADAREFGLNGAYDRIATHFFLDCLTTAEARDLASRVAEHASDGALWLISEFQVPAQGWRRLRAQAWIAVMYRFFRLATGLTVQEIPDYAGALEAAGFRLVKVRERSYGLLRCTLWRKEFIPGTEPQR